MPGVWEWLIANRKPLDRAERERIDGKNAQ